MGVKLQSTQKVSTVHSLASATTPGPVINSVVITDSSFNPVDDTAVSTANGYIKVFGTLFETGCVLYVGGVAATSTAFVSSSEIRCQLAPTTSNTQIVYVVNPSGSAAVYLSGIVFSGVPEWSTSATLSSVSVGSTFSLSLSATSDSTITYSLAAGSSLPSGTSLTSAGVFSGTVTGLELDTTYSFSVVATDTQLQDTARTFSISFVIADEYFKFNTLLLTGNGTDGATNSTFIDSSTNAGTVTRSGTPNQGSFSPYSPMGWSNYFDGTGDWLTIADNANLQMGAGNFTIEGWFYLTVLGTARGLVSKGTATTGLSVSITAANLLQMSTTTTNQAGTTTLVANSWYHFAMVRSGTATGNIKLYLNGVLQATSATAITTDFSQTNILYIGADRAAGSPMLGYISNVRLVKGTAVYTAAFAAPTAALTAITGAQLLTCQSNRFKDSSSNTRAITRNGDAKIQAFSPFPPTAAYSPTLHGGSATFDGVGDTLTSAVNSAAFALSGDYTVEFWAYSNSTGSSGAGCAYKLSGVTGTYYHLIRHNGSIWECYYKNAVKFANYSSEVLNTWVHHCIIRSGSSTKWYVNGTQRGSVTDSTSLAADRVILGEHATLMYDGSISNFRFVNGTAEYDISGSTISIPTAPVTATANTKLLLNFTNAGIIDATTKNNFLIEGQVSVSTTAPKFGTGSIYFGSTAQNNKLFGSYRTETGNFGTQDFTIEYWFKSVAGRGTGDYLGWLTDTTNASGNWGIINNGTTLFWQSQYASANTTSVNSSAIQDNAWHHIAFVRYNGVLSIYFDGVSQVSIAHTLNYARPIATTRLVMGGASSSGVNYGTVNSYIDDLRITRGNARYTAAFTPPTNAAVTR